MEYIETSQAKEMNTIKAMYDGEVNELKERILNLSQERENFQRLSEYKSRCIMLTLIFGQNICGFFIVMNFSFIHGILFSPILIIII